MKRKAFLLAALSVLALSCSKESSDPICRVGYSVAPVLETNTISVRLSERACAEIGSSIPAELLSIGVVDMKPVFCIGGPFEKRQREFGLHQWYYLRFEDNVPDFAFTKSTSLPPCIEYWEIPAEKRLESVSFNDPFLHEQWHFPENGSVRMAWDGFDAGSEEVIVAVIDGGIDMEHPDLKDAVIPGGENGSKCFVDGHEGYVIEAHGHGTHVAGIVGAVNNNGEGVCGVAGGSDGKGGVRLMSCQIFYPTDSADVYGGFPEAMQWAAEHGAVIANNSWSYNFATESEAMAGGITESDRKAIDYFIKYAGCDNEGEQLPDSPMKGGLVVFAAGNDGWRYGWPAAYEPVLAVAAVDQNNRRPAYTNYGDWVDICAPGGNMDEGERYGILSTYYSVEGGHGYAYSDGTSMACPNVSGVAALIVSNYGGEGFTADSLRHLLIRGGDSVTVLPEFKIGPLVNAYNSLVLAEEFNLTIYPNPVSDILNLRPRYQKTMDVTIYTSAGSLIYSGTFTADRQNPVRIDVSALIPGVYNIVTRMDEDEYRNSFVKK